MQNLDILHQIVLWSVYIMDFLFSILGIFFVFWGGLGSALDVIKKELFRKNTTNRQIERLNREAFASKLILGLEFFIAVDIVNTVAQASWDSLGKLGFLVAIRAVLSYVLNREAGLNGK